uniref:Protein FAR1-RELATED SEQUENCE n=1 Tax=Lactuca sativa TaxID=4236 RepID=A0A9R1UVH0_LACSA|nr:hypothetical protein LSAT_V11C700361970 [Lactuca sativa]
MKVREKTIVITLRSQHEITTYTFCVEYGSCLARASKFSNDDIMHIFSNTHHTLRSSSSYHIFSSNISLMGNKDNVDHNNNEFSDNNDRNVKQPKVNQDLKKKKRCEICFNVGHDRRNLFQFVNRDYYFNNICNLVISDVMEVIVHNCVIIDVNAKSLLQLFLEDLIYFVISNHLVLNRAENQLMDDTISAGDDHIPDQLEYPNDYVDDDEDFGLADHDSLHNTDFQIGENNNLNIEHKNEFLYDEADETIADDNIDLQKEQNHVTHDYVSPGGLSYWIPIVSDHIKAKIKSTVESYGAALSMYKNYASEAGFDVRLGTIRTTKSGIITQRHFLCNREGKPRTTKVDTLDPQHNKKDSFRCECKTKIVFILRYGTNKYIVDDFVVQHNHELFGKDNMFLSRTNRNLIILRRCLFITCKSKILVQQEHIDCISDFRVGLTFEVNSMRNLNSYIGSRDAKFLVVKMLERKKKKLNALFWADETVKYNYNDFGDVVSLDATFNMNKEYGTSYSWLLRAFLKALKKQLTLVLTDQDPTLNKVVNEVFPMSPHRFCMWHITKNCQKRFFLSEYKSDRIIDILGMKQNIYNITSQLATKSVFQKHFHSIIWNSKLEPHDFDNAWQSCLDDFNISNNKWMKDMYGLRRRWVPLFFKDIPMSGLMRSTSLSEGQNWSFQNNTFTSSYLLIRNQLVNDFNTATTVPRFITSSPIKPHASKVYTRKKNYQTQKEISDSYNTCFQMSVTSCNGIDTIILLEKQKNISTMKPSSPEYHYDCVIKDTQYTTVHSSVPACILSMSVFYVGTYYVCLSFTVLNRFLKNTLRDIGIGMLFQQHCVRSFSNSLVDSNSDLTVVEKISNIDHCVLFLSHNAAKLKSYLEELNNLKK